VYIRNEHDRINTDKSKYAIHKSIAAIKAGNVLSAKTGIATGSSSGSGSGSGRNPYSTFMCPVCQHDDEEGGAGPGVAGGAAWGASRENAQAPPFFRSENLDSIIYLYQQASSVAEREVTTSAHMCMYVQNHPYTHYTLLCTYS
jgi:hypothetical protein